MKNKLFGMLVAAGLVTLACNARAAAPASSQVVCFGFETDAGQLDVWGAEAMRYHRDVASIDLVESDYADENVFVCDGPTWAEPTVLTSYYTFSDDEGNVFARGSK